MRRLVICLFLVMAGANVTGLSRALADFGYGSSVPGLHPYYDHWRPWWGGIGGWGPRHGCSAYPAYRCAPTSGYRTRPCLSPPASNYYGYSDYRGGYAQYPRSFVYDWAPNEGDQAPQERADAPAPEPYEAP